MYWLCQVHAPVRLNRVKKLNYLGLQNRVGPPKEDQPVNLKQLIKLMACQILLPALLNQVVSSQLSGPPQSKVALQGRSTSQFEGSDKVDDRPSSRSAVRDKLMKCWLTKHHGQPTWIEYLSKVEELLTGQVWASWPVCFNEWSDEYVGWVKQLACLNEEVNPVTEPTPKSQPG